MTNTWVEGAAGSAYDVDHLPYGVFARGDEPARVGVRIGDHVVDLARIAAADRPDSQHLFERPSLNAFLGAGRAGVERDPRLGDRAAHRPDPTATSWRPTWCRSPARPC